MRPIDFSEDISGDIIDSWIKIASGASLAARGTKSVVKAVGGALGKAKKLIPPPPPGRAVIPKSRLRPKAKPKAENLDTGTDFSALRKEPGTAATAAAKRPGAPLPLYLGKAAPKRTVNTSARNQIAEIQAAIKNRGPRVQPPDWRKAPINPGKSPGGTRMDVTNKGTKKMDASPTDATRTHTAVPKTEATATAVAKKKPVGNTAQIKPKAKVEARAETKKPKSSNGELAVTPKPKGKGKGKPKGKGDNPPASYFDKMKSFAKNRKVQAGTALAGAAGAGYAAG